MKVVVVLLRQVAGSVADPSSVFQQLFAQGLPWNLLLVDAIQDLDLDFRSFWKRQRLVQLDSAVLDVPKEGHGFSPTPFGVRQFALLILTGPANLQQRQGAEMPKHSARIR